MKGKGLGVERLRVSEEDWRSAHVICENPGISVLLFGEVGEVVEKGRV